MTIEDPVEYTLPVDQPDPDQRAGRHHLRQRPAVDPAPGPRRHPGRRDPRRRDRPHRRAVRADRPLRAVVAARHRRRRRRCTGCSTWASRRFLVASSVTGGASPSAWSAGSARTAASPTSRSPRSCAFLAAIGGRPAGAGSCAGAGCNFCAQTGYLERIGVYEMMPSPTRSGNSSLDRAAARRDAQGRPVGGHAHAAGGGAAAGRGGRDHGGRGHAFDLRLVGG